MLSRFFLMLFGSIIASFTFAQTSTSTTYTGSNTTVINKNETEYDAEFLQALQFSFEQGITSFNTVGEFRPYDKLTREQASKMIGQFAVQVFKKEIDSEKVCIFKDITKADYSLAPHIIQACKLGIMKGGEDGNFHPTANLSKAQAIAVIIRLFNGNLMDENIQPWYTNYFNTARELGLTKETNILTIDRPLTRYEMLLLLYKFYVKYDLLTKFGNNFDMKGQGIKMIEETTNPDTGLKSAKSLVDSNKFLDQTVNDIEISIFGEDFVIQKTKFINQFPEAYTRYGDVYKKNMYIGVATFNIVKGVLTNGNIRPLGQDIYYTLATSKNPPYYDILQVKQSTINSFGGGSTGTSEIISITGTLFTGSPAFTIQSVGTGSTGTGTTK